MKTLVTTKLRALILYSSSGRTQTGEHGLSIDDLEKIFKARETLKIHIEPEIEKNKKLKTDEEVRSFTESIKDINIEIEFEDEYFNQLFARFQAIKWLVESTEIYGDEIFLLKKNMNDANSKAHDNKKELEEKTGKESKKS